MADISAGGAARALPPFDPGDEARAAAAVRFDERAAVRLAKIDRLNQGEAIVDTPERMAKRADRLRRHRGGEPVRGAPVGVNSSVDGRTLEQVINSADFVDIRFLEAGVAAARAVGRIDIRNQAGRVVGYGTASLISNQLAITNHHVLPSADVARQSAIELNYQDGVDRKPLQPRLFGLDPDRFYLADKDTDFAIVAVDATEDELAKFGFNRLIDVEGKAVVGEFVTIVQHPRGEKKQVSLRENRRGRPARLVPPLRDRHRAGIIGLAGVQRPVGGRRPPPRQRPGARPRRAGLDHERGDPGQRPGAGGLARRRAAARAR